MRLPSVRVRLGLAAVWIVSACLLAAAEAWAQASAPASAPATPAAATKAKLDEIFTGLAANAALWRQDKPIEGAPEIALKTFEFDDKTVPLLEAVLAATKINDPNDMYVASRLLRQLSFATTKTIQTALPAAKALSARARKAYRTFPHLTDAQLKGLQKPTDSSPKAQEALEQRRAKKIETDKAVAKQNEITFAVELRGYQLMLQAQDVAEDKILTSALIEAEKDRSDLFLALLDAVAADARHMTGASGQERAKAIYDTLRPKALELKMEPKRTYVSLGKSVLHEDDNSTQATRSEYPGIAILKVINRIAGPAQEPAMKVPTDKEIAKAQADKGKTPPTPPKKDKTRG